MIWSRNREISRKVRYRRGRKNGMSRQQQQRWRSESNRCLTVKHFPSLDLLFSALHFLNFIPLYLLRVRDRHIPHLYITRVTTFSHRHNANLLPTHNNFHLRCCISSLVHGLPPLQLGVSRSSSILLLHWFSTMQFPSENIRNASECVDLRESRMTFEIWSFHVEEWPWLRGGCSGQGKWRSVGLQERARSWGKEKRKTRKVFILNSISFSEIYEYLNLIHKSRLVQWDFWEHASAGLYIDVVQVVSVY